jgi:hypothetical protein
MSGIQNLSNKNCPFGQFSGERGIRTPGGFSLNGFQDRRNRPLCHLSAAKVNFFNKLQGEITRMNEKNSIYLC